MNRRGQSRARYEDDILAFLIDGMLEEEGRTLLEENERLNRDPAAAIPAELDERCRALLQSAFPDKPMKKPERVTWKILKRVLIAAVLAATMFATAYATVPEFRAGVLNFWTEVKEIGTYFFFYSSGEGTSAPTPTSSSPLVIKDGMPFEFSYVPEGYEPFMREARDEGIGMDYICAYSKPNDDPNNFSFEIEPLSENAGLLVDTEDAQVTEMKIRGCDGYRIEKIHSISGRQRIMYLWFDLENKLIFFYDSVGVLPEESQKIFDGIVIYGYEADTPTPPAPTSPLVIKDGMPFEFSYVPEGYEINTRDAFDAGMLGISYRCVYVDPDNEPNNFAFDIEPIDESTGVLLDTENAQVTEMKIRGCDGYLIQKTFSASGENIISYVWCDLENRLMFNYCSVGLSLKESQQIFDGIVIYGYDTDPPTPTPAPTSPLVIKDGMPFEFSYVPEGYDINTRDAFDAGVFGTNYICIYVDPNNSPNNFVFQIEPVNENTNALIDTEDAQVTEMKIRGYDGYLIQKTYVASDRNIIHYLWFDLENELMFQYVSVGIPFEESQRIFDGIVIYGYEADTPAPTPAPTSPLVIKDGMPFEFAYVPEEYELFRREAVDFGANGTDFYCGYTCTNKEAEFSFEIAPTSEGTGLFIDTEDARITNINIHGYEGQLIEKIDSLTGKECFMYLWLDLDNRLMFYYTSVGIPFEESKRIFDGIVIYE